MGVRYGDTDQARDLFDRKANLRELEFKTAKTQGQHSHGITAFLRFS
ncbi:hypothetical protein [Corynebacterium diphtheriae]|nr:hypothetical protein [Corynebacterium diphtheriae]